MKLLRGRRFSLGTRLSLNPQYKQRSTAVLLSLALPRNTAILVKLLAGPTIEASTRETVVYQSVEKALFVGATRSMSALSTASMDRVIPWMEALSRGKQYEKPNKCKPSPYVTLVDIQVVA